MSTAETTTAATTPALRISDAAARLHEAAIVADMTVRWRAWGRIDLHRRALTNGLLTRMLESGVTLASLALGIDDDSIDDAIRGLGQERLRFRNLSARCVLVRTVEDIRKAKREGKLAIIFNFQGASSIAREPGMVEVYYRLGVRHMMLAGDQQNSAAGGSGESRDSGLSRFGRELLREMNRVGMIVDLTHAGRRSSMEALEMTTAPAIFSHSNAAALCKHKSNIDDDQIRACARTGGVIGINGLGVVLGSGGDGIAQMLNQIDYVAQLVGAKHVALGLDHVFDPDECQRWVDPVRSVPLVDKDPKVKGTAPSSVGPEGLPQITEGLLKRRYSDADVRGVLGENFLRVCGAAWH